MWAFLTRVLCSAVVLAAAAGGYLSTDKSGSKSHRVRAVAPAPRPADVPRAVLEPLRPLEYQPDPLRRVYRVTAYCDRGLTAAGVPAGLGQCAAPADIPFGSKIYIPALGETFVVTDRTARRFRHNTVDLFIPQRADCRSFGRRYLECEIAIPTERVRYASPRLGSLLDEPR
jgi:3D (Asp-Asp-Asp) domain-containing protein